jgi:hypothetical protein
MTDFSSGIIGQKRPALITVIGVISIVFCSFGFLSSLYGLIRWLVYGGAEQMLETFKGLYGVDIAGLGGQMDNVVAKYYCVTLGLNVAHFLTVLSGLCGGIFLLMEKKWGILVLKIYAIAALAVLALQFTWTLLYTSEISAAVRGYFLSSAFPAGVGDFMTSAMDFALYFGLVLGLLLGSSWPILAFVFSCRRNVRDYMGTK